MILVYIIGSALETGRGYDLKIRADWPY